MQPRVSAAGMVRKCCTPLCRILEADNACRCIRTGDIHWPKSGTSCATNVIRVCGISEEDNGVECAAPARVYCEPWRTWRSGRPAGWPLKGRACGCHVRPEGYTEDQKSKKTRGRRASRCHGSGSQRSRSVQIAYNDIIFFLPLLWYERRSEPDNQRPRNNVQSSPYTTRSSCQAANST